MTSISGCPFNSTHNQDPGLESADPVEQINAGNFAKAISLLEERHKANAASAEDYARLGHAYRNTGDFTSAAVWYQKAVHKSPDHALADAWRSHVANNERDGKSGVGILRVNSLSQEYLRADPNDTYAKHPDNWVLCKDFKIPDDYVPPRTVWDHIRNTKDSLVSRILLPLGWFASLGAKPGTPGRWTQHRLHFLQLAALAYGRAWMEKRERDPDGERGDLPGQMKTGITRPGWAESGFTPDGAYNSLRWPGEARVGTEFIDHGMPTGYRPKDESEKPSLPSEADVAKVFGYRNGKTIEAKTASFHAAAHLQQLVHDVAQTAPDNHKKHCIPVDPDGELEALGIHYTWSRSDAPNALHKDGQGMHGTTVWWDMSHLYGSDIETLAKIRSFPDGRRVPGGKIFLEKMNENGEGGKWLPLETLEDGSKLLLTGFGRNMTAPLEAEHTLYARHHNWVCDVLKSRHADWSDNQIFQIARRVVTMTYVKIHTGTWTHTLFANPAVVEGLNANLFGRAERKLPHFDKKIYRPEQGHDPIAHGIAAGKVSKKKPEVKGKYFSKAYRFGHQIWVDELKCPPIGEKTKETGTRTVNMKDLRELDGHAFLQKEGLGNIYYYMMNTRLGAPVPGNTADFFRDMATEEGVMDLFEQEIRKDRQRGNASFTNYQKSHNIPPIKKWDDLFLEPQSAASQATIAKLEKLYPDGVKTLDSVLGLILNEHRPEGLAITNEGFQTFVQEATSRIRKNPWLTEKWNPKEVGWTAINIVEAIDKEKLLYLHCPELRDWLKSRDVVNTYEYVGTSPEEAPKEHPLETTGTITWGEQHIQDVGLGDAWRREHFQKNVRNTLLRIEHEPSGRVFVVDVDEETVHSDVEGKGRIHARDILCPDHEDLSLALIVDAAKAICAETDTPWPGYRSDDYPDFRSGWLLTQKEVNALKKYKGDPDGKGVPAKLTDLEKHVLVFNLSDDIETIKLGENYKGWKTLEKSRWRAILQTLGSTWVFGSLLRGKIPISNIHSPKTRPKKSTGIFDSDGNINAGRLEEFAALIDELAAQHGGAIPEADFMAALTEKNALDSLTTKQWASLFRLIHRMTGRREMTSEFFREFYSGELLFKAFELYKTAGPVLPNSSAAS